MLLFGIGVATLRLRAWMPLFIGLLIASIAAAALAATMIELWYPKHFSQPYLVVGNFAVVWATIGLGLSWATYRHWLQDGPRLRVPLSLPLTPRVRIAWLASTVLRQEKTHMTNSDSRIAVYTGSFDPITLGHLNVIERSSRLVDRLIVGIGVNIEKQSLFSPEERVELVRRSVAHLPNVEVQSFSGLAVNFCPRSAERGCCCAACARWATSRPSSR